MSVFWPDSENEMVHWFPNGFQPKGPIMSVQAAAHQAPSCLRPNRSSVNTESLKHILPQYTETKSIILKQSIENTQKHQVLQYTEEGTHMAVLKHSFNRSTSRPKNTKYYNRDYQRSQKLLQNIETQTTASEFQSRSSLGHQAVKWPPAQQKHCKYSAGARDWQHCISLYFSTQALISKPFTILPLPGQPHQYHQVLPSSRSDNQYHQIATRTHKY